MKTQRYTVLARLLLAAVLMLAVWVLLVWVASRPALKALIDLTPQRINTVDPATAELLRDLRVQKVAVQFHVFFPPVQGSAQTEAELQSLSIRNRLCDLTRTLLRSYQYLGGDTVTVHDHQFYTDPAGTREAAQRFDYKESENEILVVATQQEGRELRHRKLSLVSDLAEIDLPNLRPDAGPATRAQVPLLKDYRGEQAISSTLKSLLVQGTPIVYFLEGYSPQLDLDGSLPLGYGGFRRGLVQAGCEVRSLSLRTAGAVPPDAALVVVLEPNTEFGDKDAEALFAYVKRGGRVFVNYCFSSVEEWNPTGGRLGELLGYELHTGLVCHTIRDTGARGGGREYDGPGVEKLQLFASRLHPTTRRFVESGRPLEVVLARPVREAQGAPAGMRREPLLWTGDDAWIAPSGTEDRMPPKSQRRSYNVGLAIDVDVDAAGGDANSSRVGQVVLVTGLFCNNYGMRFSFGDLAFNICNWLTDRRVLMDIGGSRYEAKYLDLAPQQINRVFWFLVVGVPGAFAALLGFVVAMRRRL